MSLTQELAELQNQMKGKIPPDVCKVMTEAMEKLVQSRVTDHSLKVGDSLPEFTLPNAVGEAIEIKDLLAKGPVVVSFYRGAWCPYCNIEMRALQQALPEIKSLGGTLVAISPQTPDKSLSEKEKSNLTFEILSDAGNQVARKFGIAFQLSENLRPIYKSFGIDLAEYNSDETFNLPIPATYVADSRGVICNAFVDVDYSKRLDPDEILSALRNLKVSA